MNKLIVGLQDTRTHKEDFALTPYLFLVKTKGEYSIGGEFSVYGIGICLFYWAFFIGVGFNVPKKMKFFRYYKYVKAK